MLKKYRTVAFLFIIAVNSLLFLACGGGSGSGNDSSSSVLPPSEQASAISQYGITWTFDKAYHVGQFVNGDYWVLGPVTIVNITPGSTVLPSGRAVSGSMLNPTPGLEQGYDSLINGTVYEPQPPNNKITYNPALNAGRPNGQDLSASNPLVISNPASLITGVSYTDHPTAETNQVHLMAVLTVLNSVPPTGAFRPPFTGTDKSIRHTISDMHYELLPKLAIPAGVTVPNIATTSAKFQKLWPDHIQNWYKERLLPKDNMPTYGCDVAGLVSEGALLLVLDQDETEKELLALRMVQIGLDIDELVRQPEGKILYAASGGHDCGRVFPLILAGHLLQDQKILEIMDQAGQYVYTNGHYENHLPADFIQFQELDQTFYVTPRDVARTHNLIPGETWAPDTRSTTAPYTSTDIGTAEWGISHASDAVHDNNTWDAQYRDLNSRAWVGFILASRIMDIKARYNNPAIFEYMDRWMTIGYIGYANIITPKHINGLPLSRSFNAFQDQMWMSLRPTY